MADKSNSTFSFPATDPRTISLETSEAEITEQMLAESRAKMTTKLRSCGPEVIFEYDEINTVDVQTLSAMLNDFDVSKLGLARNNLDDQAVERLAEAIETNKTLKHLDLSDNYISNAGVLALSLVLVKNTSSLEVLELESNDLDEQAAESLCDIIHHNTTVKHLNLNANNLGNYIGEISNALKNSKGLTHLELEDNHIDDKQFEMLFNAINESKSNLRVLNLSYNITLHNFKPFWNFLAHNSSLLVLELNFIDQVNRNNEFVKKIQKGIAVNTTLKELYLRSNHFGDVDCAYLKMAFKANKTLKIIDLEDNQIDVNGLAHIRDAMLKNMTVEKLFLEHNRFNPQDDRCATLTGEIKFALERNEKHCANLPPAEVAPKKNKRAYLANKNSPTARAKKVVEDEAAKGGDQGTASPTSKYSSILKRKSKASRRENRSSSKSDGNGASRFRGKRKFAKKVKPLGKFKTPVSEVTGTSNAANSNDSSNDADTVVFLKDDGAPKKNKRAFAGKAIKPLPSKMVIEIDDDDQTVVYLNDSSSAEKSGDTTGAVKKTRKFAKKLNKKSQPKMDPFLNNNFNDDFQSVVFAKDGGGVDEMAGGESVIYIDEGLANMNLDKKMSQRSFQTELTHLTSLERAQSVTAVDEDNLSLDRSTQPEEEVFNAHTIRKSEIEYINRMKNLVESKPAEPVGVVSLSQTELANIESMLCGFENLLDREENNGGCKKTSFAPKGKRAFAAKKWLIGKLPRGKATSAALARDLLAQKQVADALSSSVSLIGLVSYLRSKVGSGVDTNINDMLPSMLFDQLCADQKHPDFRLPDIDVLEEYAEALLFMQVVLWNVLKSLTICDPSVDPHGRRFLLQFSKLMLAKKGQDQPGYESLTGLSIITGVLEETMDALLLLKPMFCYAKCLQLSVKFDNPMPSIEYYEKEYAKRERHATKNLNLRMDILSKKKKLETVQKIQKQQRELKAKASMQEMDIPAMNEAEEAQRKKKKKGKFDLEGFRNNFTKELAEKHGPIKPKSAADAKSKKNVKQKTKKISTRTMRYRKNCPERVEDVLTDITGAAETLNTILSSKELLPFLMSFTQFGKLEAKLGDRVNGLNANFTKWFKHLSKQFSSEEVKLVQSDIVPEVADFVVVSESAKKGKTPKKPVKQTEEKDVVDFDQTNHVPVLLNNLFNSKSLTPEMIKQVMLVSKNKLKPDQEKKQQTINHLKKLVKDSCSCEIVDTLIKATESAITLHATMAMQMNAEAAAPEEALKMI